MDLSTSRRPQKVLECNWCGLGRAISLIETKLISLQRSAEHGCQHCKLLAESAGLFRNVWASEGQRNDEAVSMKLVLGMMATHQYRRVFLQWPSSAAASQGRLIELDICWEKEEDALWPDFKTRCVPAPNPAGIEAVDFIKRNIRECQQHEECNISGPNRLKPADFRFRTPTRLLKITGSDGSEERQMVLLDTSQSTYHYIALSHCWGSKEAAIQMPKTTKNNLDQHREGITIASLTRTFQDAVDLTVKLGLQYIWIDSLCIIQDDREDWKNECPRMTDVYGGAYLVVAATAAENGERGLYIAREPPKRVEFKTPAGYRVKAVVTSRESTVSAHHAWKAGEKYQEATDLPLLQRAWAFQERLLARRIIHFTPSEIIWECRSSVGCECGDLHDPTTAPSEFGQDKNFKTKYHYTVIWGSDQDRINFWHVITAQYSARGITRSSDRIPALACIASQIDMPGELGRYLYGMWERTLPVSLLWWATRADGDPLAALSVTTHLRPCEKCIPTWSWMSVEGRVSTWGRWGICAVKVIKVPSTVANDGPYGTYTDPSIVLKGLTTEVVVRTSPDRLSQLVGRPGSESIYQLDADTHPFEYSKDEVSNSRFITILMCLVPGSILDGLFLVLREIDENLKTYERVGMVYAQSEGFGPLKMYEICIV